MNLKISIVFLAVCLTTCSGTVLRTIAKPQESKMFTDRFDNTVERRSNQHFSRVISLAPSVTESLFELGANEHLVGVTSYCNFPPGATDSIAKVGGILDFNLERILALKPDLVLGLASGKSKRQVTDLKRALPGKVFVFETRTLSQIEEMLITLGRMFNKQQASQQRVQLLRRSIDQVARRAQITATRRTLMLVGCKPDIVVGTDSFLDEWIRIAGGMNVEKGRGYPRLSFERLVTAQPQRVLIAQAKNHPACKLISNQIVQLIGVKPLYIGDDLFQRPGPRAAQAIESLYAAIAD